MTIIWSLAKSKERVRIEREGVWLNLWLWRDTIEQTEREREGPRDFPYAAHSNIVLSLPFLLGGGG